MPRYLGLLLALSTALLASKLPFDVEAMMKIHRISDPRLSPDGKTVAFTVQDIDIAANTKPRQIWVVPSAGGAPLQITREGSANDNPRWTPDSKQILFVSNRGGSSQVWTMDPNGANAKPVTSLSTETGGLMVSPDGSRILFVSSVFPGCGTAPGGFDDACNKQKIEAEKNSKLKARVYTSLLYRHWVEWQSPRRQHLMVEELSTGKIRDLTPGNRDVPPFSLGGGDDYAISPDSKEVAYVTNSDAELAPLRQTNSPCCLVRLKAKGGWVGK